VSKPQTITVLPQVSFVQDFEVVAGEPVDVPLVLSGPAPAYPYQAEFMVFNYGSVTATFESGTSTTVRLPWTAEINSGFSLGLVAGNSGDVSEISILSAAVPKPSVTQFSVPRPRVMLGTRGIEVITDVTGGDPNTWEVKVSMSQFMDEPTLHIYSLNAGTNELTVLVPNRAGNYKATVDFFNAGMKVEKHTLKITVIGERSAGVNDAFTTSFKYADDDEDLSRQLDQNNNGFADYEDGRWDYDTNGIPAYLDRSAAAFEISTDGAIAQAQMGTSLRSMAENGVNDVADIRMATVPEVGVGLNASLAAGVDISSYQFLGEFYSFNVASLSTLGAAAQVALPLDQPLGVGSEFLLWQQGAWRRFEVGAGGSLASAGAVYGVCPAVSSDAWRPGLSEGHWCVRLVIADGGVNDTDGEQDAQVLVFGGVAVDAGSNVAPVAVADSAVAVWRGSVSIPVLANDTDADGDSLSIVSASADIGTVTVNAARTAVQFVSPGDFAGVAVITYVVTDNNGGMAVGTATVTVLENRAPVLGADSVVTVSGRPVTVNVLANDADPDGDTLTIVEVSVAAASGTASYSAGSVTFVPALGFVGVATVSYSVSDNRGGSATGTLTVQVAAAPEVIEVRVASGVFWWWLTVGGLLLASRRRSAAPLKSP
jgi:hypothetical protein